MTRWRLGFILFQPHRYAPCERIWIGRPNVSQASERNPGYPILHVLLDLSYRGGEPSRYEPIKTVSSSKTQVTCNATLPLPDGGIVVIDYSFYWQGSQANIRYSVTRK